MYVVTTTKDVYTLSNAKSNPCRTKASKKEKEGTPLSFALVGDIEDGAKRVNKSVWRIQCWGMRSWIDGWILYPRDFNDKKSEA